MDLTLLGSASVARRHAYAPYSGYDVGAAVRDEQGRVFVGCNIENASFGLTLCAERVAIAKMISEGGKKVEQIAIATKDGGMPCGMCLQTLLEFAEDPSEVYVYVSNDQGDAHEFTLHDLLPHGFESGGLAQRP
jgi:cytidine deaminase